MALVECSSCNAKISSEAKTCPQCSASTAKKATVHCKTCGQALDVERQYKSYLITREGSSMASSPIMQPCPNCGDPRPIGAVDHAVSGPMTSNKMGVIVIGCLLVFLVLLFSAA